MVNSFLNLVKKDVIYNFRENDPKNNGEGAPLAPIFHKLITEQNKINCLLQF